LSNILGGSSKEIFQLNRTELLYDGALLGDALMESLFEFSEFAFFLE
jgi:hypothetical protein|tara:strand:- start:274 stop:414 length:141 start_codon:yes stop_codon:yes gene_type:complete